MFDTCPTTIEYFLIKYKTFLKNFFDEKYQLLLRIRNNPIEKGVYLGPQQITSLGSIWLCFKYDCEIRTFSIDLIQNCLI